MTEVNEAPEGTSSGGDGAEPLLKLRGIDKHFGPVQALYGVDLDRPEVLVEDRKSTRLNSSH